MTCLSDERGGKSLRKMSWFRGLGEFGSMGCLRRMICVSLTTSNIEQVP